MPIVIVAVAAIFAFMAAQANASLTSGANPSPDVGDADTPMNGITAVEPRAAQQKILKAWSWHETANWTAIHGRSLFNIHVGDGRGPWAHRTAGTDQGESLRDYDSYAQSVQDAIDLLGRFSWYAQAQAYYEAGDAANFFDALVHGDGVHGFGPSATGPKAEDYIASAMGRFNSIA